MADADTTGEAGDAAAGVDRRQVALVALCLVGLVVAAFVAPVTPGPDGPGDGRDEGEGGQDGGSGAGDGRGGGGSGEGGSGGGGGGGGDGDAGSDGGGGNVIGEHGEPVPIPGGNAPPTTDECGVVVEEDPVPGDEVTARVWHDRDPAEGVRVWFGDRYVGRTDDTGRVTGQVPYTRELNVTVEFPGADCEFYRRESVVGGDTTALASTGEVARFGSTDNVARLGSAGGQGSAERFAANVALGGTTARTSAELSQEGANDTATYAVRGAVNVRIRGDPYPGETVTLVASVEEVPMRNATVRVDGDRVGRTGANGSYGLSIPRDREELPVAVERGEFSGRATVDVWLLDVRVVPQEGLPVPGEPADVNATVQGTPQEGAAVSLDGSRIGTTDETGALGLTLPADPRRTVTVRTERQATTVSFWGAYASTLFASAALLGGGVAAAALAARVRGRAAARRVATWWTAVAATFVGLAVGETAGFLLVVGVLLVATAVRHRETVRSGGESAAGWLDRAVAAARRTALAVADQVAAALDRAASLLARLAERIADLPLSATALARRLWGWLRALPGRVLSAVSAPFTLRRAVALALWVALAAALAAQFGPVGLLAALAVGVLALAVARWYGREDPNSESDDDGDERVGFKRERRADPASDDGPTERSLRAIWRQFARRVRPGSWRQSTPAEVSRAAVERGFPERPVRVLTRAFRDVEYGDRSLSADRAEEAREAFESIERDREGDS